MKPLFLMGMMGCGKSYWGKELSRKTGLPQIDLDDLIIEQERASISEIFTHHGEAYFRRVESLYLREIDLGVTKIVSLGGGTPCYHDNMEYIKSKGKSVYLDVPIPVLVSRLRDKLIDRPLLQHKSAESLSVYLKEKLIEREPYYRQADVTLSFDNIDLKALEKIL